MGSHAEKQLRIYKSSYDADDAYERLLKAITTLTTLRIKHAQKGTVLRLIMTLTIGSYEYSVNAYDDLDNLLRLTLTYILDPGLEKCKQ